MDLLAFKVVIEPDEDEWRAYYPGWEHLGASTCGETPEEAAAAIKEVLEIIFEEIEEGEIAWPVALSGPFRFSRPSIQDAPELVQLKCGLEHADAIASHGGLPVANPETGEEYDDIYRLIYINIDDVLASIHARRTFLATRTGGLVSRIFPPSERQEATNGEASKFIYQGGPLRDPARLPARAPAIALVAADGE